MGCKIQRAIKREELTAFVCFLKKVIGPIKVHVDKKRIFDGLRTEQKECIKPRAGDADLWIVVWEELHGLAGRGILVEVEHVKAHRTKKEKQICRSLRSLLLKATRRLMSWKKQEQCWMKDFWQKQKQKLFIKKEKRCVQHCSMRPAFTVVVEWKDCQDCEELRPKPKEKWVFVEKKSENMKHRTEWCAAANRY